MKLTPKGKKRQAAIAKALKKGLPLAGLLSSLLVTPGCDLIKGIMNRHTMGRMAPKPTTITPEEAEESTEKPSEDQPSDSPTGQKCNASEHPIGSQQLTTGTPSLPVMRDVSVELRAKMLEKLAPDSLIESKIDQKDLIDIIQANPIEFRLDQTDPIINELSMPRDVPGNFIAPFPIIQVDQPDPIDNDDFIKQIYDIIEQTKPRDVPGIVIAPPKIIQVDQPDPIDNDDFIKKINDIIEQTKPRDVPGILIDNK